MRGLARKLSFTVWLPFLVFKA